MAPTKSEEKRGGKTVGIAIRKVSENGKVMTITDEGDETQAREVLAGAGVRTGVR